MRNRREKPAKGVRPTTAKVLESLLAILEPSLPGARALDLFAGTGQVGIGFLRRGARSVVFVEGSPEAARALQGRLRSEVPDRGGTALTRGKIPGVLRGLEGPFDLIWADPPYDWSGSDGLLAALSPLAAPEAVLVIEHHHKTSYPETGGWVLFRQREFGETRLSFFRFNALLVDPADEEEDDGAKA